MAFFSLTSGATATIVVATNVCFVARNVYLSLQLHVCRDKILMYVCRYKVLSRRNVSDEKGR